MAREPKRGVGRPRKTETKLSAWLDAAGMSRYELADELKVARGHVDKICSGERRPSLELALAIERITKGAVSATYWVGVPKHSRD